MLIIKTVNKKKKKKKKSAKVTTHEHGNILKYY
jgi:hypothetical protein